MSGSRVRWPHGIGLDKRQARRLRRREAKAGIFRCAECRVQLTPEERLLHAIFGACAPIDYDDPIDEYRQHHQGA